MENEDIIMDKLIDIWNHFLELDSTHPDHQRYFRDGIHKCQQVLMWRQLQKLKPNKYPIYN